LSDQRQEKSNERYADEQLFHEWPYLTAGNVVPHVKPRVTMARGSPAAAISAWRLARKLEPA
jgi:hypothetical protein